MGLGRVRGKLVDSYDLGCRGASQVALLLYPSQATGVAITSQMMADRDTHGLEFVRAWDRHKLSIIALLPFVVSVVFAVVWIGVSIGTFRVDAQVAMQTAFTVAGFIVTAGKASSRQPLLMLECAFTDQTLSCRCTTHSPICLLGHSVGLGRSPPHPLDVVVCTTELGAG